MCHNAVSAIDFNHSTIYMVRMYVWTLFLKNNWNIINVEWKFNICFKKRVTL